MNQTQKNEEGRIMKKIISNNVRIIKIHITEWLNV